MKAQPSRFPERLHDALNIDLAENLIVETSEKPVLLALLGKLAMRLLGNVISVPPECSQMACFSVSGVYEIAEVAQRPVNVTIS